MKYVRYFFEYIIIYTLFNLFKIIGYKRSSNLGEKIGKTVGPFFRSKKKIISNLEQSKILKNDQKIETIVENMWGNYGRILAEYPFINKFNNNDLKNHIKINGTEILENIKKNNKPVVFISGHFNNFELMAMQIENCGIDLAAIYRPLNNIFLNRIMENIRKNHICKKQIKKGKSGTREMLQLFKNGYSIALMIDQRVSEGISIDLFSRKCLTTTIPAQLVKKYNCEIVPVYIERKNKINFELSFEQPLKFEENETLENITLKLNSILERMILKNIDQWIWTHDRWK